MWALALAELRVKTMWFWRSLIGDARILRINQVRVRFLESLLGQLWFPQPEANPFKALVCDIPNSRERA